MISDFSFQNPTRIHFGREALSHLPKELSHFGKKILLVYGSGSVKATGLYDRVTDLLKQEAIVWQELSGVTANPTTEFVYEGIALAKAFQPDLVLAVGGGSVLDCAKVVAAGACYDGDFWQHFFEEKAQPHKALPLGTILTMAGTGSEMNGNGVITNRNTKRKCGMGSPLLYPVFSLLNPEWTFTVPQKQVVSGICDSMSHILEIYLSPTEGDSLSDALCEAILRNLISAARITMAEPTHYEARANIMWGATLALCGILEGSKEQDWMVHQIEHQIGAYTDCPHGLGLAAISGQYYRVLLPYATKRFARFAQQVWGLSPADRSEMELGTLGIEALEAFFEELGAPTRLRPLGLDENAPLDDIADSCRILPNPYHTLTRKELRKLFRESL